MRTSFQHATLTRPRQGAGFDTSAHWQREAILHQIQKIAYDRVMFIPIWEFAQLHGVGPRVEEPGLGLIELSPFSAPYEDVRPQK
jgi:hypothetical protein